MKVFVNGGTGALGRPAIDALVEAGHQVTALARGPEKAAELRSKGAQPVEVSLFDHIGLARAFEGHDAVANLASALPSTARFMFPGAWQANDKVRIHGSRAVSDAAVAAGVGLLIQESVCMIYRDQEANFIDEDSQTDRFPTAAANHEAEENLARYQTCGGTGIVLRLGWFYGPGAAHSEEFFGLARRHVCISMGRPDTYVSSIHVADGGRAVEASLRAPAGTFNIVDDEPLTKRDYADALAAAAGVKPWLRLPGRAALILGNRTTSLTRSIRASNTRFKDATGWSPLYLSAREGWMATATAIDARRT